MIKLNRQIEALEAIIEKIEDRQVAIQDRMDALEEHAGDLDRDLSMREQTRFGKLDAEWQELEGEKDAIQNAIDYIRDYAD